MANNKVKIVVGFPANGGGGGAVDSVNGKVGEVVLDKSDISLGNVDNTSDADKPISDATQSALSDKASGSDLTTLEGRVNTNEDDIETLQNNQLNPNNFVNQFTTDTQGVSGRLTVQEPLDANTSDAASVGYVLGKLGNDVQSVSGDGVNNSDPKNPVLSFPNQSQIESIRPIKTINGEELNGSGNVVTTNQTITIEGDIEDTNTTNAVSGNAVFKNDLEQEYYYSGIFDTSTPLVNDYRYGCFLNLTYTNAITNPSQDIKDYDIFVRYFRNNAAGALIQLCLSDLTPIAQINRPSVLQSGVETTFMPISNSFEYRFELTINWDYCQDYYQGDQGTNIKIDTESLFNRVDLATKTNIEEAIQKNNNAENVEFIFNKTSFDPVTGFLSDPNQLKITFDTTGKRRFLDGGTGVGSVRIEDFKLVEDSNINDYHLVYFDFDKDKLLTSTLQTKSVDLIGNFPIPFNHYRKVVGYAYFDSVTNLYTFNSDFFDVYNANTTSNISKKQTQINTEEIEVINSRIDNVGVRSKYSSDLISGSSFYDNLFSLDKDLEIALIGDSLFALTSTAGDVLNGTEQANRPPSMQFDAYVFRLWNDIVNNKPVYDRFDSSINNFTEFGNYNDSYTDWDAPDWTAEFRSDGSLTRFSSDANASISFDWNLENFEKLNFIYRKDPNGTQGASISVSGGDNEVEVYNGSAWVEANGFSFSQYIDPNVSTDGSGFSLYLANIKLKMRRVSSTGQQTITINKGNDATTLYYWGTERWNGNAIFITNIARGGRICDTLQKNILNDIGERDLDFVIVEPPLVNELRVNSPNGWQDIVNNVEDFVYGDRSGFETNKSLKSISNNFTDFQVLTVIPHYRSTFFEGNKFVNYTFDGQNNADATPYETYSRVKKMIRGKGEVSLVDMSSLTLQESVTNNVSYEDNFTASGIEGRTLTADGVHLNRFCARLWAAYINPIFIL